MFKNIKHTWVPVLDPLLVRDGPLGVPAFLKLTYYASTAPGPARIAVEVREARNIHDFSDIHAHCVNFAWYPRRLCYPLGLQIRL